MTTSFNHIHPWIFVGPFLMALAACPQKDKPGTTDDPENEDSTSDASSSTSTSTSTATPTSSDPPSTTTGETTAPSEPETTSEPDTTSTNSTSTTSTTTLDPDTTTGGICQVDLAVSLALNFDQCKQKLVLIATVQNVGMVDVPAGIDVTFYEGTDNFGLKLVTEPTSEPLPAGSSTDVVWATPAPPADDPRDYYAEADRGPDGDSIDECDETNNSGLVTDAACPG